MDRNVFLTLYACIEKRHKEPQESYIAYDHFNQRYKRVTIIRSKDYTKAARVHLANLFYFFLRSPAPSLEYLFEWGMLDDGSLFVIRDGRELTPVPDEFFNQQNLPRILRDILCGLHYLHAGGYYYGALKKNDFYCFYEQRQQKKDIQFLLSGVKLLKLHKSTKEMQALDLRSLVKTLLLLLASKDVSAGEETRRFNPQALSKRLVTDEHIKRLLLDIFEADKSPYAYLQTLCKRFFPTQSVDEFLYQPYIKARVYPALPIQQVPLDVQALENQQIFLIRGKVGTGKTLALAQVAQFFRSQGYVPIFHDPLPGGQQGFRLISRMSQLVSLFLDSEHSLIFRKNSVKQPVSNEEQVYVMMRFDELLKPVFIFDDADYTDGAMLDFIRLLVDSGVYVALSVGEHADRTGILRLVGENEADTVYTHRLGPWPRSGLLTMTGWLFPEITDAQRGWVTDLLLENQLDTVKQGLECLFFIKMRRQNIFSLPARECKKQCLRHVQAFKALKQVARAPLSEKDRDVFLSVYLLPAGLDMLRLLHEQSKEQVSAALEDLQEKGLVEFYRDRYSACKEVPKTILRAFGNQDIVERHKRIALLLMNHKDLRSRYSPFTIAEHLFKAGYRLQAARFLVKAGDSLGGVIAPTRFISYYYRALQVFKEHNQPQEQRDILERLFALHTRRGDYLKAKVALMDLQDLGYDKVKWYRKYALLLEATGLYTQAVDYYNRAFGVIKLQEDVHKKIDIYIDIARLFIKMDRLDKARSVVAEAIRLQREHGYLSKRHHVLNLMAVMHIYEGELKQAEELSMEAADIAEQLKDYHKLAMVANNLGSIYFKRNQLDKAYQYYRKAYDIAVKIDDIEGISTGLFNIGHIHKTQGHYEQAKDNFIKARGFDNRIGNRRHYISDLHMIAQLLIEKGKMSQAYHSVKQGLEIAVKLGDAQGRLLMLLNFGLIYHYLGSFTEALHSFMSALHLMRNTKQQRFFGLVCTMFSLMLYDLGHFSRAEKLSHQAMQLDQERQEYSYLPLNQAICACSSILSGREKDVQIIAQFNEMGAGLDAFNRFRLYRVIFDAARYLGNRGLMLFFLQRMRDLPLRQHSQWFENHLCLCGHLVHMDLSEEKLSAMRDKAKRLDFAELEWQWEYVLANYLLAQGKTEKAREAYRNVYYKIQEGQKLLPERYQQAYVNRPFRSYAFKRGMALVAAD